MPRLSVSLFSKAVEIVIESKALKMRMAKITQAAREVCVLDRKVEKGKEQLNSKVNRAV